MADVTRLTRRQAGALAVRETPMPDGAAAHRRGILEEVLRRSVISRLCLAHPDQAPPGRFQSPEGASDDADPVRTLMRILRHDSQSEVDRSIEWLIESGCGIDELLVDVVPAIETRLHEASLADSGDHADVTLALWRLQELVERLALRTANSPPPPRHERRALLATGEPALFRLRLQIAGEMLDRDGWGVATIGEATLSALPDLMAAETHALLVLASEKTSVESLAGLVRQCRRRCGNPDLKVLIMSAALAARPDRLVRLGADAAAADLRSARLQAGRLLALMPPQD